MNPAAILPRRIAVVGSTGSGKTTVARRLSALLGIPHVELDALHWDANWTAAPAAIFRGRVGDALAGESWVADGNYSLVRDLIWPRADTLVWLDLPLPRILLRLVWRTARRVASGEELWNGNREQLRHQFDRDSLFWWAISTYRRRRRTYSALLAGPEYPHLHVVYLRSAAETEAWLRTVAAGIDTVTVGDSGATTAVSRGRSEI